MAVNDLGLVNNALYEWNTSTEKRKIVRRSGGRMYFVRVEMAHLFEALGIIKEIRDTPGADGSSRKVQQKDTKTCLSRSKHLSIHRTMVYWPRFATA